MRTRKQIRAEVYCSPSTQQLEYAILEVLLDIRKILNKKREGAKK